MCLPALYSALYHVHNNSDIFVFTDDNSKHRELLPGILEEIESIEPRISFIMTPGCNYGNLDDTYEAIAAASGGQIYETVKRNVTNLMRGISRHLQHDWRQLMKMDFHVGGTHMISLSLEHEQLVLVSLTGKNVELKLVAPGEQQTVDVTETISMQNVREVLIERPVMGEWSLEVSGDSIHRLRVFSVSKDDSSKKYLGYFIVYCVIVALVALLCLWQYKFLVESFRRANKYVTTHPVQIPRCCSA